MLAHHPVTKQPIRILRSDAQISRDQRTLVWVQPKFSRSTKWATRWSAIVTEPDAIPTLMGEMPVAIVIREFCEEWVPILNRFRGTEIMLFLSEAAANALKERQIAWDHQLTIQELYDLYPFLGEPVVDEDPVEKVIVSAAHILRFHKLVWSCEAPSSATRVQIAAWKGAVETVSAEADAEEVIPKCYLIQQYFKHKLPKRAREIWTCLEKNLACPYIDFIVLLNESDEELPVSEKLIVRNIGERLTYAHVLRYIQSELPDNAVAVFSNSDIWFDSTLSDIWSINMESRRMFLALLRWDEGEDSPKLFGPRPDSQDSWIVAKKTVDFSITDEDFGFTFGQSGCDNAIALAMLRKKCLVVNPAYTIQTHHVHASEIRNYNPRDVLYRPFFLYVDPTAIQVSHIEKDFSPYKQAVDADIQHLWESSCAVQQSFPRPVYGIEEESLQTICSMIRSREEEPFHAYGQNMWTPTPSRDVLYLFRKPMFATPSGLLHDHTTLYVGKYPALQTMWQDAAVSSLTPSIHVPTFVSIPAANESMWGSVSEWVLQYLPYVLQIRNVLRKAKQTLPDFIVPAGSGLTELLKGFLSDCVWEDSHISTIPYNKDLQIYSENVWYMSPPTGYGITREMVSTLRSLLQNPSSSKPQTQNPCMVFCTDVVCSKGWVEEVQSCILSTSPIRWTIHVLSETSSFSEIREAMQSADWIVGEGEGLNWMWMARPGTRVVEFQHETELSGKRIHLANASDLQYIAGLVKREPIEYQRQHAMLSVSNALQKYGLRDTMRSSEMSTIPTIVLPHGKALNGIWNHSGDTFREMVHLWQDNGFCRIEYSEDTPHCWWGGIGQVLLYDRPTPRWWNPDTSYQLALFGNCPPPGPGAHHLRQSVWSFWPRSPKSVDAFVRTGLKCWKERTTKSIFLGKVENGVQKSHRCAVDWSTAVDLFSMPVDSSGGAYPYTQEEYLEQVSKARYGLCLAGYGKKCNREIEYFALGTVPIVVGDVDMTHYLRPPREGLHYIRAKSPQEVRQIVETTPKHIWERMSLAGHVWWRDNASAEGMFKLTWMRIEQCRPYMDVGIPPFV
jgi:hypothetical protein